MWRFLLGFLIFISNLNYSYACDIAPKFLEDEAPIFSVGIRDLIKDSQTIIAGNFSKKATPQNLSFIISKTFKSEKNSNNHSNISVSFAEVKHHYIEAGKDTIDEHAVLILESQILYGGRNDGGWGGPLSGIFHMSDCERSVIISTGQKYLLFLDNNKIVRALFVMDADSEKLFPSLESKIASLPYNDQ